MKKKALIITTICLAIALCLAVLGVTFAWYTNKVSAENNMVLEADGFLVVYFEANEIEGNKIKPAVAVKGAITNNETVFNVLQAGGNIAEAATTAKFNSLFRYINANSAATDVPCDLRIDCEAYMTFADGTKEKISLTHDIAVEAKLNGEYLNEINGQKTFTVEKINWGDTLALQGNADLNMEITVYLRQPDDLCIPALLEADGVSVAVTITAVPKTV